MDTIKKDLGRILLFGSSVYIQVKALENYTLDGMILAFKKLNGDGCQRPPRLISMVHDLPIHTSVADLQKPASPWGRSGTGSRDPLLSVSVGMASVREDPSVVSTVGRSGGRGLRGHHETTGAPVDSFDFCFFFFWGRT